MIQMTATIAVTTKICLLYTSYAKEALQSGAVDYLLKPVARKDLEDAVRKAIQKLEEQNTIEIFREEDDEMYQLFREINDGQGFEKDVYKRQSLD